MLRSLELPRAESDIFDMGFFAVLHQLCRIMGMEQNQGKLLAYVSGRLQIPVPSVVLRRISVEERRLAERHQLLLCGLWLMVDLEDRLRAAWKANAVRYNLMVKDFRDSPRRYSLLVGHFLRGHARHGANGVQ
jgi:hypothetical protein